MRGSHNLRYCTYLIPSSYDLKIVVAFPYRASFAAVKRLVKEKEEREADQDVDIGSGTTKNDKSDNVESKNEGSAPESTDSAWTPD